MNDEHTYPPNLSVVLLPSVNSTNTYLKENAVALRSRFPVLVTAGEQTGGRGRDQRIWISPAQSGLYSSFGFLMAKHHPLQFLPLAAGISVIETLKAFGGGELGLKWPNDILYRDKKIAGILIENVIHEDCFFCIVGMGINVNHGVDEFPVEVRERAISLKMITHKVTPLDQLNRLLAANFLEWVRVLESGGGKRIIDTINNYSAFMKGRKIRFHSNGKIVSGVFRGIDHDGGLILETGFLKKKSILYSGEIL